MAFDAAGNLYVANFNSGTVSKLSETATVSFTLDGMATAGVDYSGVTASPLSFGIGQTTANISGTPIPDPGSDKTLTVTLATPTNATLGSPATNTLTISEKSPSQSPPPSMSVAFGPQGEVLKVVSTAGGLTQFDASGVHQLGGAGVRSAGVAFFANSELLDIIFSDGTLDQFDSFGVHRLGMVS